MHVVGSDDVSSYEVQFRILLWSSRELVLAVCWYMWPWS